jgi:hypothetical protein
MLQRRGVEEMKRQSKTTTGWWLVALLPLLAACMMPADLSSDKAATLATCGSDSDCGAGLICDPKVHVCVDDADLSVIGWLRLVPPAKGMVAVEEQYPGMALNNRDDVTLTMHRPLRVLGRVLLEGSSELELQEAQIVAVADGTIPDLKIHEDANASESYFYDYENGQTEKPGFELFVNQEKTYDVYVYLKATDGGEEFPPYHIRKKFAVDELQGDSYSTEWTIDVPKITSYRHITGCIKLSSDQETPLVGAQVVAFAVGNGNVSTNLITNGAGCFDLLVQPPADLQEVLYEVRIRPSAENGLVPEQVVAEALVKSEANFPANEEPDGDGILDVDVGDVYVDGLHQLAAVQLRMAAEEPTARPEDFTGKNGQQEAEELAQLKADNMTVAMQGTVVSFSGVVGDGLLRVERSVSEVVQTEDLVAGIVRVEATLELQLPPKSFVVTVMPTAESIFGIQQSLHHFSPSDLAPAPLEVELRKKAVTRVRVIDAEEEPVGGASLLAVFSNQGGFPEAPLPSRKYVALETDEGLYEFSLDEGSYTFVVDPPVESGLPRRIERDNYVQGTSQQRVIEVSPPAALTGLVYGTLKPQPDPDGEMEGQPADSPEPGPEQYLQGPAAGVKVELYDDFEANSPADGLAPIPVASGWTDEDGRFVLIIPAH